MDLSAIKSALAAYPPRDLQTFAHLLQRFEALATFEQPTPPLSIIRQVIAEAVRDHAALRGRLKYRVRTSRRQPSRPPAPPRLCPDCGRPIGDPIMADGLLIDSCRACRWSAIVEEVANG